MADDRDEKIPSQASQKEEAEGSRETVEETPADVDEGLGARNPMERGSGQKSRPERPLPDPGAGQHEAGITNRPLPEEDENQARVPPRGERK